MGKNHQNWIISLKRLKKLFGEQWEKIAIFGQCTVDKNNYFSDNAQWAKITILVSMRSGQKSLFY